MEKFFMKAGELVSTEQFRRGTFPAVVCVVRFTYQRGWAEYDGAGWTFHLD